MSRMLTLVHAGWMAARSSAESGRRTDALIQLTRLLARTDLPTPVAADAHRLAAELLIDTEQYVKARRHLRAAAAAQPENARTYYLAGLAQESDPEGDDRRAARQFRKAAALAPDNRRYQAAFGRAAARAGAVRIGTRAMLAAANAGPDDLEVVRVVVEGLIEVGRVRAARKVLTTARFLCPRSRELRSLWERTRYEAARTHQRITRATSNDLHGQDGGLTVLPFVGLVRSGPMSGGTIRADVVSFPRPHHPRLRYSKADQ